ncbi:MAG: hypothetical protein ABI336_06015, partial [Humibacillus sp.]
DGSALIVSTPSDAAKLKRIRNDQRVTVVACDRRGKVAPEAPVIEGVAEVITDRAASDAVNNRLRGTYGLEFRAFMAIEWLLKRGNSDRVVIRITSPA